MVGEYKYGTKAVGQLSVIGVTHSAVRRHVAGVAVDSRLENLDLRSLRRMDVYLLTLVASAIVVLIVLCTALLQGRLYEVGTLLLYKSSFVREDEISRCNRVLFRLPPPVERINYLGTWSSLYSRRISNKSSNIFRRKRSARAIIAFRFF